eukprot:TRINITY_DN12158_c0_g1_i1.p1 TRINITY_DN12158_c0_g1~~TRINITY_DN12158_c0_g1_i1.p1  ORF type:complete len:295 (-),score=30.81 TRINITY_DN12158_c0_g1_i1:38-922(-)
MEPNTNNLYPTLSVDTPIQITPVYEQQTPQQESDTTLTPPDMKQDLMNTVEKFKEMTLALKIHLAIGIALNTLLFLIWHYTFDQFWWWIYPVFVFMLSFSVHKYISDGSPWKALYAGVGILNTMLVFTNFLTATNSVGLAYPWCVYTILVSSMVLLAIRYIKNGNSKFELFLHEFYLFHLMLAVSWLISRDNLGPGHPWFIYPFCIFAAPLIVYHVRVHYNDKRLWVSFLFTSLCLSVMLFISWSFSGSWFPWFLFPCSVFGFITFAVWYYNEYNGKTAEDVENASDSIYSDVL